ncbi:MAG: transglutaminase domain-containing protein, partial [Leptospiraceae bacterium]|nr:transglutaminase domain-containing protein [Leptospiraceae bacterium]
RLRGLIDQMKKEYINERNEAIREAARENNPDAQVREITDDLKYFERIDALHHGFHAYKYKLGYDEDMNMQKLSQFLFQEKEGDCTEFAQSLAMLGRLEGIPSRVVVGYLASRDLQTRAHVSGLYHLQKKIEPLQKFELEEMYLVTTSHAHAWVQFYLPGYGWIDFESTTYAIPPEPEFNPNGMDVVIPLIDEETNRQPADAFQFPWLLAGKVLGVIAVLLIVSLYCLRFGREVYLNIRAGKLTAPGLQAMLSHLLMKMARDGYALKQPHMTPLEYAEQYRALEEFAALHTMLRFRVNYAEGERQAAWQDLRNKRRAALKNIRKTGLWAWIKRRFSLRGLFYLKG